MSIGDNLSDFISNPVSKTRRKSGVDLSKRDFSVRMLSVRLVGLGVFFVLLAGLARTQVLEGAYYRDLSNGNRVREVFLPAPRGIIYDRNGKPLVSNIPAYRLVRCTDQGRKCEADTISRDQAIDFQTSSQNSSEKVDLVVDSSREYLEREATAHALGYVSEISAQELTDNPEYVPGDKIGRGGIEESYEVPLRGERGKELVEVDALGRRLKVLSAVLPKPGNNLKLGLDINLQKTAYEAIKEKSEGAAIIATNPKTGEVLAVASNPSFDPNIFTDFSIDSSERNRVINSLFSDSSRPLFDRAISGTYPPGSTFKVITSTAGLENKKIDEDFTIEDTGIIVIGPYKFANWKFLHDGGTQGVLNVVGALKVSNDIFFYKLGEKVGLDGLVSWMQKYGLARKTGIDLPGEMSGVVPTKDWRSKFAPEWYLGDTFHLAIGQGKLLVTPVQINAWTNVVANGGKLCKPHVVQGVSDCSDLGISKKTLGLIKEGLIEACSAGGTAYPLFNFKDPKDKDKTIQIACKTGTAEIGDLDNKTHAWLTAYAPANNPEISVTVLVEKGGEGSDTAAPIVKDVLTKYFSL